MKKLFKFLIFIIVLIILVYFVSKSVYKTDYLDIISNECASFNIDRYQVLSIIKAESNFKPDAISSKNAVGLMQLTLDTANWCADQLDMGDLNNSDLYVPETNIKLGVFYFNYLMDRYNDFNTAIAAYNAGMGNVDKWLSSEEYSSDGKTINTTPYEETNRYITKIKNNYKIYKLLYKEL